MKMKLFHGLVVMLLVAFWGDVHGQIISPYQVLIRLIDDFVPVGGDGNICNGAVIHQSYILTTADCMHSRIRSANISRPLGAATLYVTGGNFHSIPSNMRFVDEFYIHENYNQHTLANDIALVKLTEPLPLINNIAIQWIELANANARSENCFFSFRNQTSPNYPYTSPQSTFVMDSWYCKESLDAANSTERNNDICSHYTFNDSSMCNLTLKDFQKNSDRGTPLVCNNRLTGLLSQILPPQNVSNPAASCEKTLKTWAVYTKVSNYIQWIHQTIARTQPTPVPGNISSPEPVVTSAPFYTPPQNNPQQQPSTEKPKGSGADYITKSLTNVMLFCGINFILMFLC